MSSVVTESALDAMNFYINDGTGEYRKRLVTSAASLISTAAEDGITGIQSSENDTNSLQSLSHLDAPANVALYMLCAMISLMAFVGVAIVLLAFGFSKLRKREDAQMAAAANVNGNNVVNSQSCDVETGGIVNRAMSVSSLSLDAANANAKNINGNCIRDAAFVAASIQAAAALQQDNNNTCNNNNNNNNNNNTTSMLYAAASQSQNGTNQQQQQERPDCIWQFPPPFPPTKYKPPTFEMYNDQDNLVHGQQGLKSLRKNLGGRWRRLVRRKSEDNCALTPELKSQLRHIYVY
ncbi:M-phase inducer phosphatase isoform X2 [Trichogramma pretiosum]|uniref:M-phase inducer phosphatase isoform X2 n=1 Tax=Trichogramma pretiosum TaxID=7493 RepID=UPI0006C97F30|nr:M-phase inducer phosphatase isoform X2 [Trichogramma pretiosum]